MGALTVLRVGALAEGLVLSPERYHPRRQVEIVSDQKLRDHFEIVSESASPRAMPGGPVMVLDTSHASEGFVLGRPPLLSREQIGGPKRRLSPGDVIISRLRPYLRQVALVDPGLFSASEEGNAVVGSAEFYVLRARADLPAAALVPYLLSEPVQIALAAAQEGGHHPRFGREVLAELPLPRALIEEAPALAERFERLAGEVRRAMVERDQLVQQVSRSL